MMGVLSVLPVPAVCNLHRSHVKALIDQQPANAAQIHAARRVKQPCVNGLQTAARAARFELIDVVVAGKDALQVRKALLVCLDTTVMRCSSLPRGDRVRLEIRFPAGHADAVIHQVLSTLPGGEIGSITAWADVLPQARSEPSNVFGMYGQ